MLRDVGNMSENGWSLYISFAQRSAATADGSPLRAETAACMRDFMRRTAFASKRGRDSACPNRSKAVSFVSRKAVIVARIVSADAEKVMLMPFSRRIS